MDQDSGRSKHVDGLQFSISQYRQDIIGLSRIAFISKEDTTSTRRMKQRKKRIEKRKHRNNEIEKHCSGILDIVAKSANT